MFIPQKLVGPSRQLRQIIQIEHNIVKNPNWPETNQLAIYKHGRRSEPRTTEKQIQVVVRASLEPRTAGLRVQHAYHSATLCNGKFTRPPAQVVQRMDNAIRQENRNHVSCELVLTNKLRWIVIYPADSIIHPFKQTGS